MQNNKDVIKKWKIPLYKIYSDDEDLSLITKVIKRGTDWALGPEIEEFEKEISNYVGCDYCITVNSGTSALHASLLAYEIGSSDNVIIPSFSFIATANSVLFVNAKPRFVDIEEQTLGLDPQSIIENIDSSTKAIIPMDYGGQPCDILKIKDIAKEHNIKLIEDAAEALGSSIHGKKIGSIADASIFSFCGNKVLTTGEGGAITTNSKEIFEKIKLIRSHGRIDKIQYFSNTNSPEYSGIGYNWRMSSITAALGLSQLKKLDRLIKFRKENADYLSHKLSKISSIKTPSSITGFNNIFQMYTIRLPNSKIRNKLQQFLRDKLIFSKIYFEPIHLTDYYKNRFGTKVGSLKTTEKIAEQVLTLPLYPNMLTEEKDYLTESIFEFFEMGSENE